MARFLFAGDRADEAVDLTDTSYDTEAFVETQNKYGLSKATNLELTRTFPKTGVMYTVLLVATNLVSVKLFIIFQLKY